MVDGLDVVAKVAQQSDIEEVTVVECGVMLRIWPLRHHHHIKIMEVTDGLWCGVEGDGHHQSKNVGTSFVFNIL